MQSIEFIYQYINHLPRKRCSYYLSTQQFQGSNQDPFTENTKILKEFNESEQDFEETISIFLNFIEENQQIFNLKDKEIAELNNEVEKISLILNTLSEKSQEQSRIIQEKDTKIEVLQENLQEIESIIHTQDQKLNEMQSKLLICAPLLDFATKTHKSEKIFDSLIDAYILENLTEIKSKNPMKFCDCKEKIDYLLTENTVLRRKTQDLYEENREISQKLHDFQQESEFLRENVQKLRAENQLLSKDYKEISEMKKKFMQEIQEEMLRTKRIAFGDLKIESYSYLWDQKHENQMEKTRIRNLILKKKKQKTQSLEINKKQKTNFNKEENCRKESLLNDCENSFGKSFENSSFFESSYKLSRFCIEEENTQKSIQNQVSIMENTMVSSKSVENAEKDEESSGSLRKKFRIVNKSHGNSIRKTRNIKAFDWQLFSFVWFIALIYRAICMILINNGQKMKVFSYFTNGIAKGSIGGIMLMVSISGSFFNTFFILMKKVGNNKYFRIL